MIKITSFVFCTVFIGVLNSNPLAVALYGKLHPEGIGFWKVIWLVKHDYNSVIHMNKYRVL